jgi:putative copper export protein
MQPQRIATAVGIIAAGAWLGGLATLGAVVAPIVFRNVPAPTSADAMTLVFRRWDKVAIACAALVLLAEGARAVLRAPVRRVDLARIALAGLAAGLALWTGLSLSPHVEALHRAGAIRGLGPDGLELEAVHRVAEASGKGQVYALLAVLVLYALSPGEAKPRAGA